LSESDGSVSEQQIANYAPTSPLEQAYSIQTHRRPS
jgi:hypothetical protein